MEIEFTTYEIALALKELGFEEPCFAIYGKNEGYLFKIHTDKFDKVDELHFIKSPTFSQAFRFFREKYKLHSCIVLPINKIDYAYEIKNISENIREDFLSEMQSGIIYNSYEEAELECIKKLIEMTKEQNVK